MSDAIELIVHPEEAIQYIGEVRTMLGDIIANRIDVVDAMMADRVRANLTGQVLKARSGKLLSTVDWTAATKVGDAVVGDVHAGGDEAPYGIYFEKGGTGPYDIVPTAAKALSFIMNGQRIFARIVHHPAIPLLPWFEPATQGAEGELKAELETAFREVLGQ